MREHLSHKINAPPTEAKTHKPARSREKEVDKIAKDKYTARFFLFAVRSAFHTTTGGTPVPRRGNAASSRGRAYLRAPKKTG